MYSVNRQKIKLVNGIDIKYRCSNQSVQCMATLQFNSVISAGASQYLTKQV